jgi:diguanylate cyclase (GGDEF)-like protein
MPPEKQVAASAVQAKSEPQPVHAGPVSPAVAAPVGVKAHPVGSHPDDIAQTEKGVGKHRRPVLLVDEVTRLFNRNYFEESLLIEVERAKRYSRSVSLMFLEVTPMAPLGPKENEVANQVAEILSISLRQVDVICRLDANRYGIILPDTANHTYGIIAKRIFKYYKQIMGDQSPVYINLSASTYPQHVGNHLELYENTEKLLAQAKVAGPNKAVLPE